MKKKTGNNIQIIQTFLNKSEKKIEYLRENRSKTYRMETVQVNDIN